MEVINSISQAVVEKLMQMQKTDNIMALTNLILKMEKLRSFALMLRENTTVLTKVFTIMANWNFS